MIRMRSLLLGLAISFGVSTGVQALTPIGIAQDLTNNHRYLVEHADFIINGEVKIIQYEPIPQSHPDAEPSMGVPTTLVTYKVNRVLHGQIKANSFIRLRFIGGVVEDGGFLKIPFIPTFTKGDQDILFVLNNGISDCPLVKCMQGRIRSKNGFIANNALSRGPVALTFDGTTLYPAVEPIEPGDIHTFADYVQKLSDIIVGEVFLLKSTSAITVDARTVKYTPPQ